MVVWRNLPKPRRSFSVQAILFHTDRQEQRKGKKRTYVSKAQVRRCLRSTLLLVVCPVKVLARVTCRMTKQKVPSATTSHQRASTKWAPSRRPFVFQHPIPPQWTVRYQQASSLDACLYTMRANANASPAPTHTPSAFRFENSRSSLKSNKTYLFSFFSLSCEHLPGFNKPLTTEKCYCPQFPGGASHGLLSPSFSYLKDEVMELDIKGPSAVDRERTSTIRSWSILSFKASDKFSSLFLDMDVPSMADFPAAQRTWAESHHSKHVIQGGIEIWSRAGKWTQISQLPD